MSAEKVMEEFMAHGWAWPIEMAKEIVILRDTVLAERMVIEQLHNRLDKAERPLTAAEHITALEAMGAKRDQVYVWIDNKRIRNVNVLILTSEMRDD